MSTASSRITKGMYLCGGGGYAQDGKEIANLRAITSSFFL